MAEALKIITVDSLAIRAMSKLRVITADDVVRAGACSSGVARHLRRLCKAVAAAMSVDALLELVPADERMYVLRAAELDGYGYGDGYGDGYGNGYGNGDGDGDGYGNGYGYGYGYGYGDGDGYGDGYGNGYGYGYGYGDGDGDGASYAVADE